MCSFNFHNKWKLEKDLYKGQMCFFCQRKTTKSAQPSYVRQASTCPRSQTVSFAPFCHLIFRRDVHFGFHNTKRAPSTFSSSPPQSCKFSFHPNAHWLLPLVCGGSWLDWKPLWWRAACLESDNINLTLLLNITGLSAVLRNTIEK